MSAELVEWTSSVAAVVSSAYAVGVVAHNVVHRDIAVGPSCWSRYQVAGAVLSE